MLIVRHMGGQASQVEIVLNVVLLDLAEELIPSDVTEPLDPCTILLVLLLVRAAVCVVCS